MISKLRVLLAGLFAVTTLGLAGGGTVSAFDVFGDQCSKHPEATVCQSNGPQTESDNSIYGPNGIITKIANIIAIFVGIAAVIVIIIAGIQYMVSTGDPTKVNNAKNAIIYAIVGLIVALLARTVVVYVISKIR